jgi:hypothetical protein
MSDENIIILDTPACCGRCLQGVEMFPHAGQADCCATICFPTPGEQIAARRSVPPAWGNRKYTE